MSKGAVVVQKVLSSGSDDFTSPGIGTPNGAIIRITRATADDTDTSECLISTTFWDGTNTKCVTANSEDGQSTTDCEQAITNDVRIRTIGGGGNDAIGAVSNITDGIRITWSNDPDSAYKATATIFHGGVDFDCGDLQLATSGNSQVSGLSYEPDVFLAVKTTLNTAPPFAAGGGEYNFGVCVNDGSETERAVRIFDTNGASTSAVHARLASNRTILGAVGSGSGWFMASFDSGGVTLTATGSPGQAYTIWATIGGLNNVSLDDTDIPTATGVKSWEGPGFRPDYIESYQSGLEARNTYYSTEDLQLAIGLFDGVSEFCHTIFSEDGVTMSNTGCRHSTNILNSYNTDYADDFSAAVDSVDDQGYNFDYTTINAGAQNDVGFTLAIQFNEPQHLPFFPDRFDVRRLM